MREIAVPPRHTFFYIISGGSPYQHDLFLYGYNDMLVN